MLSDTAKAGEQVGQCERQIDGILARLFLSAYKIEEKAIHEMSDNDLTISEVHVLKEIPGERPKTMSQVAEGLKISVGALTTAMDKLVEKGYVKRFRGRTDRRTMKVMLTPNGKDAHKNHQAFHKSMVEASIDDLTDEEKDILLKLLKKVDDYFIKEEERRK
jgi:DNA-binding MarR family transcriptional regulator